MSFDKLEKKLRAHGLAMTIHPCVDSTCSVWIYDPHEAGCGVAVGEGETLEQAVKLALENWITFEEDDTDAARDLAEGQGN